MIERLFAHLRKCSFDNHRMIGKPEAIWSRHRGRLDQEAVKCRPQPAPAVTVTVPDNGSQIASPVQFKASAASPNCAQGVASMRIYPAPGVDAYTVDSSSLNTSITLWRELITRLCSRGTTAAM
jgi:hypothetical protein